MRRAYEILLRLYPRQYQEVFGAEMACVFEQAAEERRSQGRMSYAAFVLAETLGLLLGAGAAWLGRRPETPAEAVIPPQSALPPDVLEAQRRIDASIAGMVEAIAHHQFEKARFYSIAERELRDQLRRLKERYGISD